MDELGEVPWWVLVVFLLGIALTSVSGVLAWKWERVGGWYEGALFAVFVPLAVSTLIGSQVLFAIAAVGLLVLGVCVTYRLVRRRHTG